jgi:hypothetical protein
MQRAQIADFIKDLVRLGLGLSGILLPLSAVVLLAYVAMRWLWHR